MSAVKPELRTPVMTLVEASWEGSGGYLQKISARMEDKSSGGACIRLKSAVPVGSKVRIQWRFDQFTGTAKYCRAEGKEFVVGIQRDRVATAAVETPVRIPIGPAKNLPGSSEPAALVDDRTPIEHAVGQSYGVTRAVRRTEVGANPQPTSRSGPLRRSGMVYESNGEGRGAFAKLPDASMPRKSDSGNRFPERKEAGTNKERKSMGRKWLDLGRWRSKQAGATATAGEGSKSSDRNSIYSSSEKEKRMTHSNEAIEKASAQSAREVSTSKVDLVPMEDIYQAAGIMDPRRGYSIGKVVEMIHSDHMRGLSKELKQAAVLMALEAAGISVEQVQQDAKIRKNALDTYEAAQRKQVEAVWARKAEEVIQIQAELESVKAHLQARISRNLEGVAREKETFNNWLTLKQRECESMAEAVEMCVKVAAVSGATPSENAGESAKEKGVAAAKSL